MAKFLAYFTILFIISVAFSAWMVLIFWSSQFGLWWNIAAVAFGFAATGGLLLSWKDPAKVGK